MALDLRRHRVGIADATLDQVKPRDVPPATRLDVRCSPNSGVDAVAFFQGVKAILTKCEISQRKRTDKARETAVFQTGDPALHRPGLTASWFRRRRRRRAGLAALQGGQAGNY